MAESSSGGGIMSKKRVLLFPGNPERKENSRIIIFIDIAHKKIHYLNKELI
jgi:hypothetical protein